MTNQAEIFMHLNDLVKDRNELLYAELAISTCCLFCNTYFAFRFSAISTFNPNLRIIIVVFQIFTAMIGFLHPLLAFTPEQWYSIEDKNYVGATIYYIIQFYVHICLFLCCSKFAALGIERHFAVKHRENYEQQDGKKIKKYLLYFVLILTLILFIKSCLIFYFDNEKDLQTRIEKSVMIDKNLMVLIAIHMYGGTSWLIGLYEFMKLSIEIKKYWYSGRSLSESYQIKQSGTVVKILKPITIAFIVLLFFNGSNMCLNIYLVYFLGFNINSPLVLTLMNIEYTSVAIYNLYVTIYMLLHFKPLRKKMFSDIATIFFIKVKPSTVVPYEVKSSQQQDDHFAYLNNYWNKTLNELRRNNNYMLRC